MTTEGGGFRITPPAMAERVQYFTESVIREMTRLANQHGAINLSQGMPDFDPPEEIKEAACRAIRDGYNQYAITWALPRCGRPLLAKPSLSTESHAIRTPRSPFAAAQRSA